MSSNPPRQGKRKTDPAEALTTFSLNGLTEVLVRRRLQRQMLLQNATVFQGCRDPGARSQPTAWMNSQQRRRAGWTVSLRGPRSPCGCSVLTMLGNKRSEISTISGVPGIRFRQIPEFPDPVDSSRKHTPRQRGGDFGWLRAPTWRPRFGLGLAHPTRHPADAARSCFNRGLEAELINMSGGGCVSVQIVDGELPHTPSGRALTVSLQL